MTTNQPRRRSSAAEQPDFNLARVGSIPTAAPTQLPALKLSEADHLFLAQREWQDRQIVAMCGYPT